MSTCNLKDEMMGVHCTMDAGKAHTRHTDESTDGISFSWYAYDRETKDNDHPHLFGYGWLLDGESSCV